MGGAAPEGNFLRMPSLVELLQDQEITWLSFVGMVVGQPPRIWGKRRKQVGKKEWWSEWKRKEKMIEIQDLLYQLRLSEQASTQLFEKKLGISLTRYQILLFLLKHSPCNQIAVQERLKIDQAALTRHFKILEKEGLVERHRNPKNQREVLVEATKYAKEQLVVNPPLQHIKVKEEMESILTESERTELSRLLNKLVLGIENIEI